MGWILIAIFASFPGQALATEKPVIKSWKTLRSDIGYEFKYPSCWEIQSGVPEVGIDEHFPETFRSMSVDETDRCSRSRFDSSTPNGIDFTGGYGPKNKKADGLKEIALRERNAPGDIRRREILIFKKFKVGNDDAIAWVEMQRKFIRWEFKIFCPDWWISVSGPKIENANVTNSYYEKFKKGDLALPEPEKTIIESIRCIPAKQKED